jgi:biopolymer transport protein ExbD
MKRAIQISDMRARFDAAAKLTRAIEILRQGADDYGTVLEADALIREAGIDVVQLFKAMVER